MILVVAVVASTLVALLRGGRLSRLADLPIKHAWLALAAVALQFPSVFNWLGSATLFGVPAGLILIGVSSALVVVLLWLNRRLPGVPLIALGMVCNLLVMALNGGWMPITPEALSRLGQLDWVQSTGSVSKIPGAKNGMLARADTRLWWLSDIFVLADPFPVPAAFSLGDVFIAAGVYWLLRQAMLGRVDQGTAESSRPAQAEA